MIQRVEGRDDIEITGRKRNCLGGRLYVSHLVFIDTELPVGTDQRIEPYPLGGHVGPLEATAGTAADVQKAFPLVERRVELKMIRIEGGQAAVIKPLILSLDDFPESKLVQVFCSGAVAEEHGQ